MTVFNRTVFDIPLTWNRTRFVTTRNKCRLARKLIEISINVQYEKQMRDGFSHNIEIEENINAINERLLKCHDKIRVLDNMIELASQSLRTYFDKRMESVRAIVKEHCNIIQEIIYEEAEHWKEIHSVLNQNLLNPGDIRSRNNYPRILQKSPAPNIETIEEEDDNNEERVSRLLNAKTITPLLTQMLRKSHLHSKRLTLIPSIKVHIPSEEDISIFRKDERFSVHILPLSTARQPLEIVDTTFVVKPDETMMDAEIQNENDDNDEPNGTYRAPNDEYHSYLPVHQPETLLIDTQPNIPARLCFTPTMLQDATVSAEDDFNEQSSSPSSPNHEKNKATTNMIFSLLDQNRMNIKKVIDDNRHFGQTFLLDNVKTIQNSDDARVEYKRPTISDDDVLVVNDTNNPLATSSKHISHTINNNRVPKSDPPIQKRLITVQESIPVKSRIRKTTRTKSKPIIATTRKTRSAAKILAEREAAAKASLEKALENKRKTRKRKPSKSIDRLAETSDDENTTPQSNFTQIMNHRRKTKRRKTSKTDYPSNETSDDENITPQSNITQIINHRRKTKRRKTSKTDYHSHDTSDDDNNYLSAKKNRKTEKRSKSRRNEHQEEKIKNKKFTEQEITDEEDEKLTKSTKRKKSQLSTNDNEENKSKSKKRKRNIKKTKIHDEEQMPKYYRTRSSAKRNHRPL